MPPESFVVMSGFCWIGVYFLLVKRGFQDKIYGMPLVPMSVNIAWETVFSLVYPIGVSSPWKIIIAIWMILDALVVATFFLYGYEYFAKSYRMTRLQFYIVGGIALLSAYVFFITAPLFLLSFSFFKGSMFEVASFLAYAVNNVATSILFVWMFRQRGRSIEGQSFYIGLLKWIGTLIVAVWYLLENNYLFAWVIIATIEIFDILYLKLVYDALTEAGINPWLRF
jgi:hypothetical protein